eukprot:15456029-Alexandrium_andersonii.AAC.1
MDRGNFLAMRRAMLESRNSEPGFEFAAEAICFPVASPLVRDGYPSFSKEDLDRMLQQAAMSGRAHAVMAALGYVSEERHAASPRLFD